MMNRTMMLTALDESTGVIVTLASMDAATFDQFHSKRARRMYGHQPICRLCFRGVNVVYNTIHGTRFWRHDPGQAKDCIGRDIPNYGESHEHATGILNVFDAFSSLRGWQVEMERPVHHNGDLQIIDVAAHYLEEKQTHQFQVNAAWEIQMSKTPHGDFAARTTMYREAEGLATCWVTPWSRQVEALQSMICDPAGECIVDQLLDSYEPWRPAAPAPIATVVKGVHRKHRTHNWFQGLLDPEDEHHPRAWWVTPIGAFGTPTTGRRHSPSRHRSTLGDPIVDRSCEREPVRRLQRSTGLRCEGPDCEYEFGPYEKPWGGPFDGALCFNCYLKAQSYRRLQLPASAPVRDTGPVRCTHSIVSHGVCSWCGERIS